MSYKRFKSNSVLIRLIWFLNVEWIYVSGTCGCCSVSP
jgi:hypothetical protein